MNKLKEIALKWGWLLFTIVVGGAMVVNIATTLLRSVKIKWEINHLEREANLYKEQIKRDSTLIESLKYDHLLEKYAREKHGMQRSNEDVYIIEE